MDPRSLLLDAARRHGVPQDLVMKVANTESAFNQRAVSPKGAIGVMQLMPGTAKDLGVDPHDMAQNIDGGVRYLARQLKDFGTPELALAAYNAGPGAVRKYGGVPPYAETQGYVRKISGGGAGVDGFDGSDIFGMGGGSRSAAIGGDFDGSEIFGPAKAPAPRPGQPGAKPPPQIQGNATPVGRAYADPKDIAALSTQPKLSPALSVMKGTLPVLDKMLPYSPANLIPGFKERAAADTRGLHAKTDGQAARPGYQFAGATVATAPAMLVTRNPMIGGALTGALGSEASDAEGIAKDAAIGGAAGRLTAGAMDLAQLGLRQVLSKAPNVLKPAQLPQAVKDAYAAVDASGFTFGKKQVAALADDFAKTVNSSALSKTAKDDARAIIDYTRGLSKGDLTLAGLEKLRGDIYTAMVKKGSDTGVVGKAFRDKIDAMIDGSGDDLVRTARDLNARYKKADVVTRASKSADRVAEKDYGGDYGRKLKDRLNPLVDEMKPNSNLRGATPDEKAAIDRIVRGTKAQNAMSTVAGMLDPRRLGGKILSGISTTGGGAGAPFTGGLSLLVPTAQMGTGLALTRAASNTARANLDDLVRLIAAGGSKQALARVPTQASYAAEKAVASARPAAVAAPLLTAADRKKKAKR